MLRTWTHLGRSTIVLAAALLRVRGCTDFQRQLKIAPSVLNSRLARFTELGRAAVSRTGRRLAGRTGGTAERGGSGAVARVERPAEVGGAAKAPAGGDLGDGTVAELMVSEVGSAPA